MASVGHLAVGLAAARLWRPPARISPGLWASGLGVASLLPDLDLIGFAAGVPYAAPFGHRGALHSLIFAALCGLVVGLVSAWCRSEGSRVGLIFAIVTGSHGFLDSLTTGGLGIALLWPFSDQRFFAPWRFIPVAPLGPRLLAPAGLELMLKEAVLFLPLFVGAVLLSHRRPMHTECGR